MEECTVTLDYLLSRSQESDFDLCALCSVCSIHHSKFIFLFVANPIEFTETTHEVGKFIQ